jgi:hypothetical protein
MEKPMPSLKYLVPRVIRHFMPDRLVRFLLLRSLIIRPGMETNDPARAAEYYIEELKAAGISLQGKRILVFGYGGRFAVGCALLRAGASNVILCEKGAPPDSIYNRRLLAEFGDFLQEQNGQVLPRGEALTLVQGDIRQLAGQIEPADIVLSVSVYEHLEDVEGITAALTSLTATDGIHLHFVDLRDHFFKYPFEMLCYDKNTWTAWLNPTSNHNRYRLGDYRRTFETWFENVDVRVTASELEAFLRTRSRIRPEFLSGNDQLDATTLIRVLAARPRPVVGRD